MARAPESAQTVRVRWPGWGRAPTSRFLTATGPTPDCRLHRPVPGHTDPRPRRSWRRPSRGRWWSLTWWRRRGCWPRSAGGERRGLVDPAAGPGPAGSAGPRAPAPGVGGPGAASGDLVEVEMAGGPIAQVRASGGESAAGDTDLTGQVLMPSFVEPHAHLDKALTASRVENVTGDLPGAIEAMEAMLPSLTAGDFAARAEAALRLQLAYGTTSIRTHVNVGAGLGMRALAALIEVREPWRGLVDLQLVALVSNPLARHPRPHLPQSPPHYAPIAPLSP